MSPPNLNDDCIVWKDITYKPAIPKPDVKRLLDYVDVGMKVCEVGCNTGAVSCELAQKGLIVHGVDLNPEAIAIAVQTAKTKRLEDAVSFEAMDLLQGDCKTTFDVVVACRVLTCFPNQNQWDELRQRIFDLIRPGGLVYINDFAVAKNSDVYANRYRAGIASGLRKGSFVVPDTDGSFLFVAHHHSDEDIRVIGSNYKVESLEFSESLSMNGNACRIFELIGRKPA